ncbi:hypothetical protein [Rhodococcus koreensis]
MLSVLPDLARRIPLETGVAYHAFDRFDVVAMPTRLILDAQLDGLPALRLSKVRGGTSATSARGQLDVDFVADANVCAVGKELVDRGARGHLLPYQTRGGVLLINGPDDQEVRFVIGSEPNPRLGASFEISSEQAVLATEWIRTRKFPFLGATLRLRILAVATRHPVIYRLDPHAVAVALGARLGVEADVSVSSLGSVLDEVMESVGAEISGERQGADSAARGVALALRMLGWLTTPTETTIPLYRLRPPDDVSHGLEIVDLSEPAQVHLDTVVELDRPAVEAILEHADVERVLHEVDLPTLPTGRTTVGLSANLVQPVAGLLVLIADIRMPARPPIRPQSVSASAELAAPSYAENVVLDLAPGEEIDGEVRLRAVIDSSTGVLELPGEFKPAKKDWLLLGPDAFPLPLSVVRLSDSLAEIATVEVVAPPGRDTTVLDAEMPTASIPVSLDAGPAKVALRPRGEGASIELELAPGQRLDLSPEMLPGFGVHAVVFSLARPDKLVAVEWRREGSSEGESRVVALGPASTTAEVHWVATSPFQPGFVWRIADPEHEWSAPIAPSEKLSITVDAS